MSKPKTLKGLLVRSENFHGHLNNERDSGRPWHKPFVGAVGEGYNNHDYGARKFVLEQLRSYVEYARDIESTSKRPSKRVVDINEQTVTGFRDALDIVEELIEWAKSEAVTPPPVDPPKPEIDLDDKKVFMAKVLKVAPKANIQRDLIEVLVFERKEDCVTFEDLQDEVWDGNPTKSATIRKMIKGANETLKKIGAGVEIHVTRDKAKAVFFSRK